MTPEEVAYRTWERLYRAGHAPAEDGVILRAALSLPTATGAGLGTQELAIRAGRIGASQIAAIAGLNPWHGPLDTFLEMTGRHRRDGDAKSSHGHRWEKVIVETWCAETGMETAYFGTVVHPTEPWACATPDRAIFGRRAVLECKLVGARVAHHWQGETPPEYVVAQAAWQMACTNADECHVAAFIGGTDFRRYVIARDLELEATLAELGRAFYFQHIVPDDPPEYDGKTPASALAHLWRQTRGDMVPAPDGAAELVAAYKRAAAAEKAAEEAKNAAKAALCALIGEHDGIESETFRATWKWRDAYERPACVIGRTRVLDVKEIKARKSGKTA